MRIFGRVLVLGGILGACALVGACVGDDSANVPDASGSDGGGDADATTADANGDGANGDGGLSCDGGALCNGTCVDTSSDPVNCGRCAHDCGKGQCSAGVCQAVLMAGDPDGGDTITSIATEQPADSPTVMAQHVFWSMTGLSGGVFQDNVTGGNTVKLSTNGVTGLSTVVVNQGNVYWYVMNPGGPPQPLLKAQVGSAGSQAAFATENGGVLQSMLYDPGSHYLYGNYQLNVTTLGAFKCGPDTGSPTCSTVITYTGTTAGNVATDGTRMYFCDIDNGAIDWTTFTNSSGTYIQGQATPNALRVDGNYVYWFNSGTKTVVRATINGPTPKQLAAPSNAVDALAADAVNVYFTEHATGNLSYAPITGAGPTTPYVTNLGPSSTPMRLVRDTAFLYFSHNTGIYRVALP